jgi:hypothetical protein
MKYLWKSLTEGKKSLNGNVEWKIGKWRKHDGELSMCNSGFHASENIIDAMGYVNCFYLARVAVRGEHLEQNDKQVWSEMKAVKIYKWTKENSVRLAIFSAELVIDIFEKKYPSDKRPRQAIEAAKAYLKNPEDGSAYSAAHAAACAAHAAANAAVSSATFSAEYAANAAANAAHAAACAANAATNAAEYSANAAHSAAYSAEYAANAATNAAANMLARKTKLKCHNFVLTLLEEKSHD